MCTIDRRKEPGKFDTIIDPCTSCMCAFYFSNIFYLQDDAWSRGRHTKLFNIIATFQTALA